MLKPFEYFLNSLSEEEYEEIYTSSIEKANSTATEASLVDKIMLANARQTTEILKRYHKWLCESSDQTP